MAEMPSTARTGPGARQGRPAARRRRCRSCGRRSRRRSRKPSRRRRAGRARSSQCDVAVGDRAEAHGKCDPAAVDLCSGGSDTVDQGVEDVWLRAVHERQVGLVGHLQRPHHVAVSCDERTDELGPAIAVVGVAQVTDDDVVEDAVRPVPLGEAEDGVLAAGLHVDQVHTRRDAAEVVERSPDLVVVVGRPGGQALGGAGDAQRVDGEFHAAHSKCRARRRRGAGRTWSPCGSVRRGRRRRRWGSTGAARRSSCGTGRRRCRCRRAGGWARRSGGKARRPRGRPPSRGTSRSTVPG